MNGFIFLLLAIVPIAPEPRPVEVDCIEVNIVFDGLDGPERWRAVLIWRQVADGHHLIAWNSLADVRLWQEGRRWRASWVRYGEQFEVVSDELITVSSAYGRAEHDPTFCRYPLLCYEYPCSCRLHSMRDKRELLRRVREGGEP
jgi:hypothetical protein